MSLITTIFKHTIFGNLFKNAIKFSYINGSILIKLENNIDNAEINISNIGPAIPYEKLNNIFSVTSKTTTLGTLGEKGTGVGLPLVYKFINKMNGHEVADKFQSRNISLAKRNQRI